MKSDLKMMLDVETALTDEVHGGLVARPSRPGPAFQYLCFSMCLKEESLLMSLIQISEGALFGISVNDD